MTKQTLILKTLISHPNQGEDMITAKTTSLEALNATGTTSVIVDPVVIHKLTAKGDLSGLSSQQQHDYYMQLCRSLKLNPASRPFAYLKLGGKIVLYALRDCTDQLRKLHHVSIKIVERKELEGVYIVRAIAKLPNGREDESAGAVPIAGYRGEALCNQILKCETKAKRRVTLSICGLGFLDETEIESIPDAKAIDFPKKEVPTLNQQIVDLYMGFSEQEQIEFRNRYPYGKKLSEMTQTEKEELLRSLSEFRTAKQKESAARQEKVKTQTNKENLVDPKAFFDPYQGGDWHVEIAEG